LKEFKLVLMFLLLQFLEFLKTKGEERIRNQDEALYLFVPCVLLM
jgi:hypothetical protein